MMDFTLALRTGVALMALAASLGLVTWRQSRALEALARLDDLRRQSSVATAELIELERKVQVLESRAHVVPLARDRLGLHMPAAPELVILPGDLRP